MYSSIVAIRVCYVHEYVLEYVLEYALEYCNTRDVVQERRERVRTPSTPHSPPRRFPLAAAAETGGAHPKVHALQQRHGGEHQPTARAHACTHWVLEYEYVHLSYSSIIAIRVCFCCYISMMPGDVVELEKIVQDQPDLFLDEIRERLHERTRARARGY